MRKYSLVACQVGIELSLEGSGNAATAGGLAS